MPVKEADFSMMIHAKHASQHGFTKSVLASVDTDVMVLALFQWSSLHELGVLERWVRTGVKDSTRRLSVHVIHRFMGQGFSSLLPC